MFNSRFMPCTECGDSVDQASDSPHQCSPERRADYQMFGLRDEVAQLQSAVEGYLGTAAGRFETWLAARQVRATG
jgi:hypothetical protein